MKIRQSNFELLRIISMFLILLGHCFEHTTWPNTSNILSNILININKLSCIGLTCFMLITGYFQCNNTRKNKNIIILSIQTLFYSLIFTLIFYFIDIKEINVSLIDILTSFFPIIFKKYWFITAYIIIYIISPYLNKFIQTLSKEDYKKFLLILTIIFTIIPTITTSNIGLSETSYLIYLYFMGAYIKLHYTKKIPKRKYLIISIICVLLYYLSVIIFSKYAYLNNIIYENINYFFEFNKIPTIICSISLFLYFKEIKITNKFINKCASYTLGIYLIHDNNFMRELIWNNIVKLDRFYNSKLLALYGIEISIIVFVVCALIEMIRKELIEKRYIKLIK